MLRRIVYPVLNDIHFVPVEVAPDERYNTPIPYYCWFSDQLRSWETKVEYFTKRQNNDPLNVQFKRSYVEGAALEPSQLILYSCDGEALDSQDFVTPSGAPVEQQGTTLYNIQAYASSSYFDGLPEGKYYLLLRVPFDDDVDGIVDTFDEWISEPIHVKSKWENTLVCDYGNSFNTLETVFEQFLQKFTIRFEGALLNPRDYVNRVTMQDQNGQIVPLSADPYSGVTLYMGGNGNFLPDYLFRQMNSVLTLDSLRFDNTPYTPAENAALQREYIDDYPLYTGRVDLIESEPDRNNSFTRGTIVLFTAPVGAFVINKTVIGYQNYAVFADLMPYIIESPADLAVWFGGTQALIAASPLKGVLVQNGSTISYRLGNSETIDSAASQLLSQYFSIVSNAPSAIPILVQIGMRGAEGIPGTFLLQDPAGNIETYGVIGDVLTTYETTFVAPAAGPYFYNLFHDDQIGTLVLNGFISDFTGTTNFPSQLRNFTLGDSSFLTELNLNMLARAKAKLETVTVVNNSGLTLIAGYNISAPWQRLRTLNYSDNNLDSNAVDDVLNDIYNRIIAGGQLVYNGFIDMRDQTIAAPPTAASLDARNELINNYNWAIQTD